MSVLYISYDGILEPLGQSQVLSYIRMLASERAIYLISFEKNEDLENTIERRRIEREVSEAGIVWYPLKYHKRLSVLATTWDILNGLRVAAWVTLRHRLRIVHSRSYVPSVISLILKRMIGVRFIFDMRGFWADEKVDGGIWRKNSQIYRLTKWFEKQFFINADHVISLTRAAVPIIQDFSYLKDRTPPITVIPTCADLNRFKPTSVERKNSGLTVGYVGTAGNWYLFHQTAACFADLLHIRPETKFLIVNRGEHAFILECLSLAGVPTDAVELISASPSEMPGLISRMDASIFFIKPTYSKQASAATKLAELLGCGVPCLSNAGVGDMEEVLERTRVGIAIKDFNPNSVTDGLHKLLALIADPDTSPRCMRAAEKYFSLNAGVVAYSKIYRELI